MAYNWQQADWPDFRYKSKQLEQLLLKFLENTAHVNGMVSAMPEHSQVEAMLNMMVSEAIKTSEIEGEFLSRRDVVSSIRNNLGLNKKQDKIKDKKAEGAGKLMVAVRNEYTEALSEPMLCNWHKMLMADAKGINTGAWRKDAAPMQVISGAIGKEKVHFEAPPSVAVAKEMSRFIRWFNNTAPGRVNEIKSGPIRAAIAHLYFESIHPFEDGNGRIGRAIAEKALAQTIGRPLLLSLSLAIEGNKKAYYEALEHAQRSNEITKWLMYFVTALIEAQEQAHKLIAFTLQKTKFFDKYLPVLNERQLKAINKMLNEGPKGFDGGMTAQKYISITKTSKATATRDLQLLHDIGVLTAVGAGRSTHYHLNI